jgi:ribose 5-phosphate isomerase
LRRPETIEIDILKIAGVVQVGLFNKMCDVVVLAGKSGVETLINPNGRIIN